MPAASVGFFGKLPTHGDFITRRVPPAFQQPWDEWLQRCIAESQSALGGGWLDWYLTSPIWRFFLSEGAAGPASMAGILVPSVDRVGRYFPLTVIVELPSATSPLHFAAAAQAWFENVEHLCATVLQNEHGDLSEFDAAIEASGDQLGGLDKLTAAPQSAASLVQWRGSIRSARDLGSGLAAPLVIATQQTLRPLTLWWTDGSQVVEPSVLLVRGLPHPSSFAALLAGNWADAGWSGDATLAPPDTLGASAAELQITSAGATDAGAVRSNNQDNLLRDDGKRLWAVADGLGGHSRGEVASQMVVDALQATEPTATLGAALDAARVALERVNADLRRSALQPHAGGMSGSTVVALVIRGGEWAALWAGDSRAYLYRDGELRQLTRDHSLVQLVADGMDGSALGTVSRAEITRAVGGEDLLQLDQVADSVVAGDRFLLCSDGLYTSLAESEIVAILAAQATAGAAQSLIDAARRAGARDNVTAVIVDVHASA